MGWAGKESKSRINSPGSDKRLLSQQKTAAGIAVAVYLKSIARYLQRIVTFSFVPDESPTLLLEIVRRRSGDTTWTFLINHGGADVVVPAEGTELVSQQRVSGELALPAGAYAVVKSD